MTRYKPYPKYKDSGVEWLGKVPEHWGVRRLRFAARLNPAIRKDIDSNSDLEVSFLPMEAIGEDGSLDLGLTRPVSSVSDGYSFFENSDVAFAKVTPCFENGKGAVLTDLIGGVGFGTTELTVLRSNTGIEPRFLNYTVRETRFRSFGVGSMTGAGGLKRVPDDFTRNYEAAWPPIEEQQAIANALDVEIERLNTLLAQKTKQIDLLREKRQAVIAQAVTTGLKPDVEMKVSGIPWLGHVPAAWTDTFIKRIVLEISQGWSPDCESRPADEGEWAVLKVGCVNGGTFRPSENKALPATLIPRPVLGLRKGDVLISRANTRELVGSCAVVVDAFPKHMLCDKLYRVRADERKVSPEFLAALISVYGRREVEVEANGASSSMVNISQSVILDLRIALPSLEEQGQINTFIELQTSCIDALIAKTERSIELLKERRSALITAAVTGQIDLRDAA